MLLVRLRGRRGLNRCAGLSDIDGVPPGARQRRCRLQPKSEPTVVRQHERVQCQLAAVVRIAPEMEARVVFSGTVCGTGRAGGTVGAEMIDCSRGGLGLKMKVFVPKHAKLVVRVACGPEGEQHDFAVVAQRVKMLDRGPTYYVGASFPGGANEQGLVDALIAAARATAAEAAGASAPDTSAKEPARA